MAPFAKYALFVLLGITLGAGGAALAIIPKANAVHLADQQDLQRKQEELSFVQNSLRQTEDTYTKQFKQTMRGSGEQTLLYDPQALAGLNAAGTPPPITYPTNRAVPYNGFPRWIIPGKVKPTIAGSSAFASYSYYDPQKDTYDGPYLPNTPTLRQ